MRTPAASGFRSLTLGGRRPIPKTSREGPQLHLNRSNVLISPPTGQLHGRTHDADPRTHEAGARTASSC